jgi:hypothetical protein
MQSPKQRNDRQMVRTHTPKPVYEQQDVTLLRNQAVYIERKVTANVHDIINTNKKDKTCILIDVAIPTDRNMCKRKRKRSYNTRVYV